MKRIIEDHVCMSERENKNQIKRYFDQEKGYINSGHKDFKINFERKKKSTAGPAHLAPRFSPGRSAPPPPPPKASGYKIWPKKEKKHKQSPANYAEDEQSLAPSEEFEQFQEAPEEFEPTELNILNFENDPHKRKQFYDLSKDLVGSIWEDDAIILEGTLQHLKIIQDSFKDKLPKIIHFEIFYATKVFVEKELTNVLTDEIKENPAIMYADESELERRQNLEVGIKQYEEALQIVNNMRKMIRNSSKTIKRQNKSRRQGSDAGLEDMSDEE